MNANNKLTPLEELDRKVAEVRWEVLSQGHTVCADGMMDRSIEVLLRGGRKHIEENNSAEGLAEQLAFYPPHKHHLIHASYAIARACWRRTK